jgi:hypothetical protein
MEGDLLIQTSSNGNDPGEKTPREMFSLGMLKILRAETLFFSTENIPFSTPMSCSKPHRSKDDRRKVHTNNNRTGQK